MTTSKILLFSLLALTLSVSSCSKDNNAQKDIQIDENNLTSCGPDSDCRNLIYANSDFSSGELALQTGAYRIFQRNVTASGIDSYLFIKVPMNANSFSLDKKDILNGRLKYTTSCVACYMLSSKVTGGYAKGVNLSSPKNADQAKWIIEAQVILTIGSNPVINDTVYVKQYFYTNAVQY